MTIAGRAFPPFGACGCGIHWTTIRNVTPEDIGRPGIAHSGNLTRPEYHEIEQQRQAEDERIALAMGDLAK